MPIEPDARIWVSLLRGCRIHHDVKLAEKVAESNSETTQQLKEVEESNAETAQQSKLHIKML